MCSMAAVVLNPPFGSVGRFVWYRPRRWRMNHFSSSSFGLRGYSLVFETGRLMKQMSEAFLHVGLQVWWSSGFGPRKPCFGSRIQLLWTDRKELAHCKGCHCLLCNSSRICRGFVEGESGKVAVAKISKRLYFVLAFLPAAIQSSAKCKRFKRTGFWPPRGCEQRHSHKLTVWSRLGQALYFALCLIRLALNSELASPQADCFNWWRCPSTKRKWFPLLQFILRRTPAGSVRFWVLSIRIFPVKEHDQLAVQTGIVWGFDLQEHIKTHFQDGRVVEDTVPEIQLTPSGGGKGRGFGAACVVVALKRSSWLVVNH